MLELIFGSYLPEKLVKAEVLFVLCSNMKLKWIGNFISDMSAIWFVLLMSWFIGGK